MKPHNKKYLIYTAKEEHINKKEKEKILNINIRTKMCNKYIYSIVDIFFKIVKEIVIDYDVR